MKNIIFLLGLILFVNQQIYVEASDLNETVPKNNTVYDHGTVYDPDNSNITVPNTSTYNSLDPKQNTINPEDNNYSNYAAPKESVGSMIPKMLFRILNFIL